MNYLPDIYSISETISEIQKKYIEEDDGTMMLGIYGYLNEVNANTLQNAILVASEYGNEAIPIRSKFERTILTNAITYDIQDINAKPATMKVMIGFVKSSLDEYLDNNKYFTLDRYSDINIEDYTFHLDYDIIIRRHKLVNGNIIYAANYDINFNNTMSDIVNPYLASPIISNIQGDDYIFIICDIRQTSLEIVTNKVITNNILQSKTFDVEFENQLAKFNIFVEENGVKTELIPVYEGLPYDKDEYYCYYTYINSNIIRIKFDRQSYQPALNCEITVEVYTTLGSGGNFTYDNLIMLPLTSTRFDYKNIKAIIKSMTSSVDGADKKTTKELQRIIPKRMLSRGGIINTKDLQNYFDMIDVNNRLVVYKKRDNQIERLYYAYLLAKDESGDIVPTNTIDINLNTENFDIVYKNRYILKPGREIYYDKNRIGYYDKNMIPNIEHLQECDSGCGCIVGERHPIFTYCSPFITIINKDPLSISYYLDLINRNYIFNYEYINQKSILQFISTGITLYKNYLYSDDYVFRMNLTINNNSSDSGLIEFVKDEDGKDTKEIDKINMVVVLAITSGTQKYYIKGEIISYNDDISGFTCEFRVSTNNCIIDENNQIQITNLYRNGENSPAIFFINQKVNIAVYTYVDKNVSDVASDSGYSEDISIPSLKDGYVMTNKYIVKEDVYLFYNYSSTINSVCKVEHKNANSTLGESYNFTMKSIPLIRHDYLSDSNRLDEFIEYLQYRKSYIDTAQDTMEDSFNVDLKFFNTYGPSKLFTIGRKGEELDRVNLTLEFGIKLSVISNTEVLLSIQDSIKEYIEDINNLDSIHMSNLCSYIKQTYDSDIDFIEFEGINTFNANYQYIERNEPDILEDVPEFVNINLNTDMEPDIKFTII